MKYALVAGERREASPGLEGICPACQKQTHPKCGRIIIWHWAHKPTRHCDPWWEGETEWHRTWKAHFAQDEQEVIQRDPTTGEIHIADIKTANGVVIELQNSPMTIDEMLSREAFYGDLIWVVNGTRFVNNFHVLSKLPPPQSEIGKRLYIARPPKFPMDHDRMGRRPIFVTEDDVTRCSTAEGTNFKVIAIGSHKKVCEEIEKAYEGHHYLDWRKPRAVWLCATAPVFFDFGTELLFLLERFNDSHLCVRACGKKVFLAEMGSVSTAL
jgi:competence protein CoiA